MDYNYITDDKIANFCDLCMTRKRDNLLSVDDLTSIAENTIILREEVNIMLKVLQRIVKNNNCRKKLHTRDSSESYSISLHRVAWFRPTKS